MALFDDPDFLLSHIRNSFITSDDTGISELAMLSEDYFEKRLKQSTTVPSWIVEANNTEMETDVTDLSQSCDIVSVSEMDYALRRRSNTAQRLERLKKDKKKQAKFTIFWRDPEPLPIAQLGTLFNKKTNLNTNKPKKSLLSEQLEKIPSLPANPFSEYAKFDGNTYSGIPCKTINIFLTMLPPEERAFPMTVTTVATARVQDLVGLICWQYTILNKEPKLRDSVDCYSLHIAEDDGEVDLDFPCLDTREAISKFGFTILALVENKKTPQTEDEQIIVTVNIPQVGFSKIPVNNLDVTLQEILDKTLKRRKGMIKAKGLEYYLEKQNEPGIPLDLDSSLGSLDTLEFCLVRANSKRGVETPEEWQIASKNIGVMEAPLFQLYKVLLTHQLYKTEVHLGISGEKIELLPAKKKSAVRLWPLYRLRKPISHDIDTIAACEILELKYTGKTTFRLTYKNRNSHDFKHHDFEADGSVARDIVQQITHIIEFRSNAVRADYLVMKERKLSRRNSFTFRNS